MTEIEKLKAENKHLKELLQKMIKHVPSEVLAQMAIELMGRKNNEEHMDSNDGSNAH